MLNLRTRMTFIIILLLFINIQIGRGRQIVEIEQVQFPWRNQTVGKNVDSNGQSNTRLELLNNGTNYSSGTINYRNNHSRPFLDKFLNNNHNDDNNNNSFSNKEKNFSNTLETSMLGLFTLHSSHWQRNVHRSNMSDEDYYFPNANRTRRIRRDAAEIQNACYKFSVGNNEKSEFFSPNYPEPYPKDLDCFKIIEAEPGMVLKVEFRVKFELEDHESCDYDYLEVRDGKYGYSRFIGKFCRAFPFPEITSSSRYLWLHFHSDNSIQGHGFRAIWTMVPRPAVKTPETEECVLNVTNAYEHIIKSTELVDERKMAIELGTELDCLWVIVVPENWKIQLTFPSFHLDKPNQCDINYVQVYDKEPTMPSNPSLISNFCGSIADLVTSKGNEVYLRFYATKAAINSNFEALMTAIREKESKDKGCEDNEFDCQDACISNELKCNGRPNCRYRFDEDSDICTIEKTGLNMHSEHVIIILFVFSTIVFGLCFSLIYNCTRELIEDHKIIKENLRQSRDKRLQDLSRKSSPCSIDNPCQEHADFLESPCPEHGMNFPMSNTPCPEHGHYDGSSVSLDVVSNAMELVPTTNNRQDICNNHDCQHKHSTDLIVTHQSDYHRQETLPESYDCEPEMISRECQTRESLFENGYILRPSNLRRYTSNWTSGEDSIQSS